MKVQFKHAFLAGVYTRGIAFLIIFAVNFAFIALGSLGLLPFPAHITGVALSGVAVSVMFVFNVVSDIAILRRMFVPPGAYVYALIPEPRWKTLFAGVAAITVMDIVTMAVSVGGVVWLSINMAGNVIRDSVRDIVRVNASDILFGLWLILFAVAGYLLFLMIILFCVTMKRSVFYQKPAAGLLAVLTGFGLFYIASLLPLLAAPFGAVSRLGTFFMVSLGRTGLVVYTLLILAQAAALFIMTAKLMERKMNI